jgi:hypothetical protein
MDCQAEPQMKLFYLMIMLASALLLNTAYASTPVPRPRTAPQQEVTRTLSGSVNPVEQDRHNRREESLEYELVILTAVLAGIEVVTFIVFFFTMLASIRAANAAKASAEAAKESVDTAGETLKQTKANNAIDQRAYVYLSSVRVKRYPPNKVGITYPIFNAGKTPAVLIGEYSRADVFAVRKYPEPYKRAETVFEKRSVVVPPTSSDSQAALNPTYWLDLMDEEIEAISKEESQIVFHGIIRYLDIFGNWHDTGFGVAYSGALMPNETRNAAWIPREGFNWFD